MPLARSMNPIAPGQNRDIRARCTIILERMTNCCRAACDKTSQPSWRCGVCLLAARLAAIAPQISTAKRANNDDAYPVTPEQPDFGAADPPDRSECRRPLAVLRRRRRQHGGRRRPLHARVQGQCEDRHLLE